MRERYVASAVACLRNPHASSLGLFFFIFLGLFLLCLVLLFLVSLHKKLTSFLNHNQLLFFLTHLLLFNILLLGLLFLVALLLVLAGLLVVFRLLGAGLGRCEFKSNVVQISSQSGKHRSFMRFTKPTKFGHDSVI